MDIPDYLANSSPDGKEWIKRKNLNIKMGASTYYRRNGIFCRKVSDEKEIRR